MRLKLRPAETYLLFFTSLWIALLAFQIPLLNGPWYWTWQWRHIGLLRALTVFSPPLLLLLYSWGLLLRKKSSPILLLLLFFLTHIAFQLCGILLEPNGLSRISELVSSYRVTGYFGYALEVTDFKNFLSNYHDNTFSGHPSTHPPGLILFFVLFLSLFTDPQNAALFAGITIGLITALSIPLSYICLTPWYPTSQTRLQIAMLFALAPAPILFLPSFDQCYIFFTLALLYLWEMTLRKGQYWGIIFGFILTIISFFAYNLLALGALFAFQAIFLLLKNENRKQFLLRVLWQSVYALSTVVILYLTLYLFTGFQPVESFLHALSKQASHLKKLNRPYVWSLLFDPYGFLLGSGMAIALLYLATLYYWIRHKTFSHSFPNAISITGHDFVKISISTLILITLSHTLPAETTRLWIFLLPLVIAPAGALFACYGKRMQLAILLLSWMSLVVIKANLWFLKP